MAKLSIFGAGSWGTALADTAARNGHEVLLWSIEEDNVKTINESGFNPGYLNNHPLEKGIRATTDLKEAAHHSDNWLFVVPTQAVREVISALKTRQLKPLHLCNAAKGFEISTMSRISEIAADIMPEVPFSVLSGPSHAEEVIQRMPTAVVVASEIEKEALHWQELMNGPVFRVYTGHDVAGVEVGAAVKNVIAVASGMARAMELGDNTTAALVSRGLAEIMRLGAKMGAHPLTLAGLAGVGDLVVTCYSFHSRNFRLGMALGEGKSLEEAKKELGQVAEGAYTVKAMVKLASKYKVELPIAQAVNSILYQGVSPKEKLKELLTRDPKPEYPPNIYWSK